MKKTVSVNIKYPRIRLKEYKHLSRDLLLNLKEFLTHCIKLKIFEKNSYIYQNYAGNNPKQIQRLMKGEIINIYFRNDIRQISNLFDNLNPAQFRGKNCTITGRHFQNLLNPIKEILGDNFHITNSTDSLKEVFNRYITTLWNNLFKSQQALSFNGKDFNTLYQECGTTTNAFTTFAYLGMDNLIATIERLKGRSALAAIDAGCEELSEMRKLTLGYANTHPEIDLIPFYDENRLRTYETTLMLLHDRYAVEQSKMAPLVESSFQLNDEKKQSSQPRIDASAELTQENKKLRAEIAKLRAENELTRLRSGVVLNMPQRPERKTSQRQQLREQALRDLEEIRQNRTGISPDGQNEGMPETQLKSETLHQCYRQLILLKRKLNRAFGYQAAGLPRHPVDCGFIHEVLALCPADLLDLAIEGEFENAKNKLLEISHEFNNFNEVPAKILTCIESHFNEFIPQEKERATQKLQTELASFTTTNNNDFKTAYIHEFDIQGTDGSFLTHEDLGKMDIESLVQNKFYLNDKKSYLLKSVAGAQIIIDFFKKTLAPGSLDDPDAANQQPRVESKATRKKQMRPPKPGNFLAGITAQASKIKGRDETKAKPRQARQRLGGFLGDIAGGRDNLRKKHQSKTKKIE